MKKLLSLILVLVILMTATGCAGDNSGTVTRENANAKVNADTAVNAPEGDYNIEDHPQNIAEIITEEIPADKRVEPEEQVEQEQNEDAAEEENSVVPITPVVQSEHVHTYATVITEASCTNEGYTTHQCDCGHSYISDKTSATGHSFGEWETTKAASTTSVGTAQRLCGRCNTKETKTLGKLTNNHCHEYSKTITREATCTLEGVATYTCTCGEYFERGIAKDPHDYEYVKSINATCVDVGYTVVACSVCGYTVNFMETDIDPKGHAFVETVKPATCTEPGSTTNTCQYCGTVRKAPIEELGHWWTITMCQTNMICDRCGEKGDYVDHSWTGFKPVCDHQCKYCKVYWHELYGHQWGGSVKCAAIGCMVYDQECVEIAQNIATQILE